MGQKETRSKIELRGLEQALRIYLLSQYMKEPVLVDFHEGIEHIIRMLIFDRSDPLLLLLANAKGRPMNILKIDDVYAYLKNTSIYLTFKSLEDENDPLIYKLQDGANFQLGDMTRRVLIELAKIYDSKEFAAFFDLVYLIKNGNEYDMYRYILAENSLIYLKSVDIKNVIQLMKGATDFKIIALPVINVLRIALVSPNRAFIYALMQLGTFINKVISSMMTLQAQLGQDIQIALLDDIDAIEDILNIKKMINMLAPIGIAIKF